MGSRIRKSLAIINNKEANSPLEESVVTISGNAPKNKGTIPFDIENIPILMKLTCMKKVCL